MSKSDYTGINLNKQGNYIIVVSPKGGGAFDIHMQIAKELIDKNTNPKVVVISNTYKNESIQKIPYSQVQTFKAGTIRLIDRSSEEDNFKVVEKISSLLKNGTIIIDSGFGYTNEIAAKLLSTKGKGQDYVIHREAFKLLDAEIDYLGAEFTKIENHNGDGAYVPEKNIILCLHNYPGFPLNEETLTILKRYYGEIHAFNIILSYYISQRRTVLFRQQLVDACKAENESPKDFINPNEYRRQTRNYVYYNLVSGTIMDNKEFVEQCRLELMQLFIKDKNKPE